jgi:3-deoxy-7-phosphoheptulonate synthase
LSSIDNPLHDREVGVADLTQDTTRIDDVRIGAVRPLISPALLQDELPVPPGVQTLVEQSRVAVADILHGRDDRLVVVVGPCSIHDHDQALDYARRLKARRRRAERRPADRDARVLRESRAPRSAGRATSTTRTWTALSASTKGCAGRVNCCWKSAARPAHRHRIPRPAEPAIHRRPGGVGRDRRAHHRKPEPSPAGFGLSCPIGFKNGTDGGVQIAADAIVAAGASHAFMGMTKMGMAAIFETRGNDDAHVILRGGKKGPNYDSASVEESCAALRKAGLREQVMIDCSHANSGKSHLRQIEVAQDLAQQLTQGEKRIIGVMIESNLEEGRQDLKPGVPLHCGVSITDACLSWVQTEPVLDTLAQAARDGQGRSGA